MDLAEADMRLVRDACRQDKNCPFCNFTLEEDLVSFEYEGELGKRFYKFSITDDYPYNSVISWSTTVDGACDTKMSQEPFSEAFQRIAQDLYRVMQVPSMDNNNSVQVFPETLATSVPPAACAPPPVQRLVSTDTDCSHNSDNWSDVDEYDYYRNDSDEEEYNMHPQLTRDMDFVKHLCGDKAIFCRSFANIDSIDVELSMDMECLDVEIAHAWKVKREEPLVIRLPLSVSSYLDGMEPKVEVFQPTQKQKFGVGSQMRKILENFLQQQWKMLSNEQLKIAVGDNEICTTAPPKKKHQSMPTTPMDASPLSPGPSGDVDSGSLAQVIDMGFGASVSRNALLLSNGVVPEAVNLLVMNPEMCLSSGGAALTPSKDKEAKPVPPPPPCRPAPTRPARPKAHVAARKKSPKATPPTEAHSSQTKAQGSSTKSWLGQVKGIFSSFFPQQNAMPFAAVSSREAKNVPTLQYGFLVHLLQYAYQRLLSLNEFCVICDEEHVFQQGGMLKPTVCPRELCVFAFQTLGVMSDAAEDIATGADVVDLLIAMANAACKSQRKQQIFEPFPTIVDPTNARELALHPNKKDYARVETALAYLLNMGQMTRLQGADLKKSLDQSDILSHPLLQWIISSNRSHIVKLPPDRRMEFMHTPHQFLMLSSSPAKEAQFRVAKEKFGSTFAFHGSNIENWHSILRQGLMNASGTKFQTHGAAYGNGIYLSPHASLSFSYSNMGGYRGVQPASSLGINIRGTPQSTQHLMSKPKDQSAPSKNIHARFLESKQLTCIALCEVVKSKDLRKHSNIWVAPDPNHVCTRFFFVYEDGQTGEADVDTTKDKYLNEIMKSVSYQMR